jgi:hypothetical protein
LTAWEEPKELDTDNEAVISLYDGIRKILDKQSNPKLKQETKFLGPQDTSYNVGGS